MHPLRQSGEGGLNPSEPLFSPPRIAIIGSGGDPEPFLLEVARNLGSLIATRGAVLVCGGKDGVMAAAAQGCTQARGAVLGILPSVSPAEANPWITLPVVTGLGHLRNALVVLNADAVVALPGGAGTLLELSFARLYRRPAVTIGFNESGFPRCDTPEEALDQIWPCASTD